MGSSPLRPYIFICNKLPISSVPLGEGRDNCSLTGFSSQSSFPFPLLRPLPSLSRCQRGFPFGNPSRCWGCGLGCNIKCLPSFRLHLLSLAATSCSLHLQRRLSIRRAGCSLCSCLRPRLSFQCKE